MALPGLFRYIRGDSDSLLSQEGTVAQCIPVTLCSGGLYGAVLPHTITTAPGTAAAAVCYTGKAVEKHTAVITAFGGAFSLMESMAALSCVRYFCAQITRAELTLNCSYVFN